MDIKKTREPQQSAEPTERPDIRTFTDYRAFLERFVAWKRTQDRRFSFRSFARAAGFSSPNYLKLVMDGDRNLSVESAPKFVKGLDLRPDEGEVFSFLVALAGAKHDSARNAIYTSLREKTRSDSLAQLRDDQFSVYDHWWVLAVRELAELPGFECDAQWVAQRVRPKIRPAMAQKAIDLLLRLGLWRRDPDSGEVTNTDESITSGLEPSALQALAIRNYHRAHLELAARSLDEVPRESRNITSVVATLSPTQYAEAVEVLTKARRTILDIAARPMAAGEAAGEEAGQVHQLLFALFPVSSGPGR